jgi:hypothetical protein
MRVLKEISLYSIKLTFKERKARGFFNRWWVKSEEW